MPLKLNRVHQVQRINGTRVRHQIREVTGRILVVVIAPKLLDWPTAVASQVVQSKICRYPPYPALCTTAVILTGPGPDAQEGLLGKVVGGGSVTHNAENPTADCTFAALHQLRQRTIFAFSDSLDEVEISHVQAISEYHDTGQSKKVHPGLKKSMHTKVGVVLCNIIRQAPPGATMSKFDPRFWEIPFDPQLLDQMSANDGLEGEPSAPPREIPAYVIELLQVLIRTRLTPRQQRVLEMYFYEALSETEIASQLGISQQVVSKHLFGAIRDGKKVGGAVRKLRKIMSNMDIDPKKWV